MTDHSPEVQSAITTLAEAGITPEAYIRAYWAQNPPAQPDDASQVTVRLWAYGTTTADYDRDEWRQAVDADELDHLIDHDASDLDTDTLIVDGHGAIIEPY